MASARTALVLVMVAVAVTGMVTPAVAGSALLPAPTPEPSPLVANHAAASDHTNDTTDNGTVAVGVGPQLSTIITATSDDTQSEFEDAAFEFEFERANESDRAEAIAERAAALRDRAEAIRGDYEAATESFEAGNLTRAEYAQRIASLNARAANVLASLDALRERAGTVSALELRAAGVNRSQLRAVSTALDNVTGVGPTALLQRFTGGTAGEVELEAADGLSIEVEGEDGERSRELKRPQDADRNLTVNGSAALETARNALSAQASAWVLLKASVHPEEGYYKFEFAFRSANETGEAEVRVDGSSGSVFRLEEEIEPREDDDPLAVGEDLDDDANQTDDDEDGANDDADETEGDEAIDDLAVVLASGSPSPGAAVTVQVIADGDPLANTTVFVNGEPAGTTDASGRLTLTLPTDSATITGRAGGEDGELEVEFDEDDEVFRQLDVSVSIDGGTATVTVRYNGSGVANAGVFANDRPIGTTTRDGTVSFSVPTGTDELEIEVVKGAFEAEVEFELTDDGARQTSTAHEGDGDKVDDEEDDRDDEAGEDADDSDEGDADDDSSDSDDEEDDSSGSGSGDDEEDDSSGSDSDDEDDSSGSGSGDDDEDTSGTG